MGVQIFKFLWQRLPSPINKYGTAFSYWLLGFWFSVTEITESHKKMLLFHISVWVFNFLWQRLPSPVIISVTDPGCLSRTRIFSIPDPGSESKNLSILNQILFLSSRNYDPGCSSRIRILIFNPSRIRIRNTAKNISFSDWRLGFYLSFCDIDIEFARLNKLIFLWFIIRAGFRFLQWLKLADPVVKISSVFQLVISPSKSNPDSSSVCSAPK